MLNSSVGPSIVIFIEMAAGDWIFDELPSAQNTVFKTYGEDGLKEFNIIVERVNHNHFNYIGFWMGPDYGKYKTFLTTLRTHYFARNPTVRQFLPMYNSTEGTNGTA